MELAVVMTLLMLGVQMRPDQPSNISPKGYMVGVRVTVTLTLVRVTLRDRIKFRFKVRRCDACIRSGGILVLLVYSWRLVCPGG